MSDLMAYWQLLDNDKTDVMEKQLMPAEIQTTATITYSATCFWSAAKSTALSSSSKRYVCVEGWRYYKPTSWLEKNEGKTQHLLEHLCDCVWSIPLTYGFPLSNSHLGCITRKKKKRI